MLACLYENMQAHELPNEVSIDNLEAKAELAVHEWLALLAIGFFLFFLTILSYVDRSPNFEYSSMHYLQPLVEVNIEGEVVFPGLYRLPAGSPILTAIQQSIPLPSADLSAFKASHKVRVSQFLHVPAKKNEEHKKTLRKSKKTLRKNKKTDDKNEQVFSGN